MVPWFGGSVVRRLGGSSIRWFGGLVLLGFGGLVVRFFCGSGVWWFGGSVVRWFGAVVLVRALVVHDKQRAFLLHFNFCLLLFRHSVSSRLSLCLRVLERPVISYHD